MDILTRQNGKLFDESSMEFIVANSLKDAAEKVVKASKGEV